MAAVRDEPQVMIGRHPTTGAPAVPGPTGLPIARNTALLSAAVAAHSGMQQLFAAVGSITLVLALGVHRLLGLGPAIVLAAGALAAVPMGRWMDRFGRVPVLAGGFCIGAAGCGFTALGSAQRSALLVIAGLVALGTANGALLLARTAGGDMYPPERRARGIALVLFGSVFGAILGPAVFSPLLAGRALEGETLALLWLAAGGFELVGLALVVAVRPDPKEIAVLLGHTPSEQPRRATPIGDLMRRPGVVPALVAAQASLGVMVAVMTLTGAVVVDHLHHQHHNVFPIIGVHVIGMYALVILVGGVVDRIGRTLSLSGGLVLISVSVSALLWVESVPATATSLFALGVGWNLSFVAATAELADRTEPWDRGRLMGFNDLLAGATGAGLTLLGGLALTAAGVTALATGGAVLALVPALWILRNGTEPPSSRVRSGDGRARPHALTTLQLRRGSPPSPGQARLRSGLFLPLFDELADPVVVADLAAEAEEAGWHGFFVWDQVRWREPVIDVADPWITLAAVATATEAIRLGPMVTPLARRRPAKVARETATLDVLSEGRLTLGVGLGSDHFACEFSMTGEELDDGSRARMLDESLEVLAAAWSGEPVQHRGDHYRVDGMRFLPRPVQRPGVPVWVAGSYGATRPLRRAARHQGFFPGNLEHPDQLAELATRVTALRDEARIDAAQPYDIIAALPPGRDPAPYAAVGATWWLVELPPGSTSVDGVRGVIHDGPAPPTLMAPAAVPPPRGSIHERSR
jgi:MFS family permease